MTQLSSTGKPSGNQLSRPSPVELRWHVWAPWLALMTILISATRTDPDLWGHVRFGLDWLTSWRLPEIDPYSFTQDRPWVNHEWLSEAFMGAAYQLGGSAGLVILKMIVVGIAVAVIARRLRRASPLLIAVVTATAIVGALPVTATIRPQLWSLLALVLLATALGSEPPTWRRIALVAALFALWANFHGGWVTGGGVLALHIAIRVIRDRTHAARWLALGCASLAATLLNPYGVGLWRFLASTVRTTRPDISEWQAFSTQEPLVMWVAIAAPVLLLAWVAARRQTSPELETMACVVLLVLAGLRVSRVAPLMCPAALAMLAPNIAKAVGSMGTWTAPNSGAASVLLVPALLMLIASWSPASRVMTCLPTQDEWAPDLTAAASLQGTHGRLWTTFNWGQFAIWHFGPDLKVSIDGRRETVYSDAVVAWNRAAEEGQRDAIAKMLAASPDYVWLPASRQQARQILVDRGYRVEVDGTASFILSRRNLPPLRTNTAPLSACFP
jgi:hypothetical protein